MTGQELIGQLREAYPDIAIVITKIADKESVWDGDGPDPVDLGYAPHHVIVTAVRIRKGRPVTATTSLGSVYLMPNEPLEEVHGYLPQMVRQVVNELRNKTEW